jgi:threonine dehydratase
MAGIDDVTPEAIADAAARIAPWARHTPIELSRPLSERIGAQIWLKMEIWQATGSFKMRGAANRMAQLDMAERARGVVAVSSGNHALGIAACAERMGIHAIIVVPEDASAAKVAALRRFDPAWADLRQEGRDYDEAEAHAMELAGQTGALFISSANDAQVITGQGTVAYEMLDDVPDLDLLVVPVGGGGLAAGIGVWASSRPRNVMVWGVQSEASPVMHAALEHGAIVPVSVAPSIADGVTGNIEANSITVPLCRRTLAGIALMEERAIAEAVTWLADEHQIIVEGAGAIGVAALLSGAMAPTPGSHIGVVLTGRNIAGETLRSVLSGAGR